ncbi:AAA family ATPase [Candidatus Thiosymbion oneisti]|uniref:AAA family ATPase n=1 Tax=Candidatus Thiosymbion oneisti TaxID=589554 RepID=UPI000AFAA09E|nr:AAA family ATPase [Candidatus Thiosymbion oneisti]
MKISIKNLGVIKQAEFALGELTIICGHNNTGKTYATYALFGFLSLWRDAFSIEVPDKDVQRLLSEGSIDLDLNTYVDKAPTILKDWCGEFTEQLPRIFASPDKHFSDSHFSVDLDPSDIQPNPTFERTMGAAKAQLFSIAKKADSQLVTISLLVEKEKVGIPPDVISRTISNALKDIIFGNLFPRPFIASAERTGAAIFRKELNFNGLLEEMTSTEKKRNFFDLLFGAYKDYALPVTSNVEFNSRLERLTKKESFISKDHTEILHDFADIIGGDYLATKDDDIYYLPKGKRVRLTMDESSSAVRSLLDIGFYLRHVVAPGDLLMIDEPELNLHPENQRRIARLFARLVNLGIKVFITTHSDYIIKELNTLIMLNQGGERLQALAEREHYGASELLAPEKVRVYIAEEALIEPDGAKKRGRYPTLVPADIDGKYGIEARSFDKTIEDMNRIQEEIVWGDDES